MPWQIKCAGAWGRWLGNLLAGLGLQELSWLSLFLPPPTPPPLSQLCSFYLFKLCSLPLSSIFFCISSPRLPPLPPCSMRHQVCSATLGCRTALRASSATACLRVRGPGHSLQTSMKPFIIWTGCSRVSLRHTSMNALDVFARCDV